MITDLKMSVISTCIKLLDDGLIVRTWGNVSCRINDKQFAITPTGRDYRSLEPSDIVVVNIDDLSYEGDIKPSSEKGIHADVYRMRHDVNFVIHTHQMNASIVSVIRTDVEISEHEDIKLIGDRAVCANYGLSGTDDLRKNVRDVIMECRTNSIILANHGALCIGADCDRAFMAVMKLEKICGHFIHQKYAQILKKDEFDDIDVCKYFLSKVKPEATYIHHEQNDLAYVYSKVYEMKKCANNIFISDDPYILVISQGIDILKPLIDDFAQMIGADAKIVEFTKDALEGNNTVIIRELGAIVLGKDIDDRDAAISILKRQCKAYVFAYLVARMNFINELESQHMRNTYINKYSKQIIENK